MTLLEYAVSTFRIDQLYEWDTGVGILINVLPNSVNMLLISVKVLQR